LHVIFEKEVTMEVLNITIRINGIEAKLARVEGIAGAVAVEHEEVGREESAMDDSDENTFAAGRGRDWRQFAPNGGRTAGDSRQTDAAISVAAGCAWQWTDRPDT
jgi:hypothetical protein